MNKDENEDVGDDEDDDEDDDENDCRMSDHREPRPRCRDLWPGAASAARIAGCSTLHLNSLNWCTRIAARALAEHVELLLPKLISCDSPSRTKCESRTCGPDL